MPPGSGETGEDPDADASKPERYDFEARAVGALTTACLPGTSAAQFHSAAQLTDFDFA